MHANRAACELVGKPPEEVVGKLPAELFDPVTVERWAEQNREILRTGRPIDVEDGWGGRTHLTHKTPVFDADGKTVRGDRHLDRHHRPQARRGRAAAQREQPGRGAADRGRRQLALERRRPAS